MVEAKTRGQTALVRLACADDDAQGQTLEVFWDYELDRRILEEEVQNTLKEYGKRKRLGEERGLFHDRRTFSEVVELTSRGP